jgi:hypothetical protein
MFRVPLFFLIFFLFLNSYPAHAIQPAFIKGTILNTYNNSVISDATISTTTGLSITASSGTFFLRMPPNVYDIIVSAHGYYSNNSPNPDKQEPKNT